MSNLRGSSISSVLNLLAEEAELPTYLTKMEWKLLHAYFSAESLKGAASELGISYHTARTHLHNIYFKLETHSILGVFKKVGWLSESL